MTRYAAALLAGVVLALAPAAPAAAHASLLETDPAEGQVLAESPGEARLTFDETVSVSADGVQVFDAQGESVTSEAATRDEVLTVDLPDTLAEGTYVVSWRVVSADGHPVAGALTFSVGKPSAVVKKPPTNQEAADGTVRGILSAVQGVGYLGLFVAAGLVLFVAWLLPGAARLEALRRRLLGVARAAAASRRARRGDAGPAERRLPAGPGTRRRRGRSRVVRGERPRAGRVAAPRRGTG